MEVQDPMLVGDIVFSIRDDTPKESCGYLGRREQSPLWC